MAYTRLFLQDDSGAYPCAVPAHFKTLPKPGAILNVPGRPAILVQAVRPALWPREDGEAGIPARVYAVALNAVPVVETDNVAPLAYAA